MTDSDDSDDSCTSNDNYASLDNSADVSLSSNRTTPDVINMSDIPKIMAKRRVLTNVKIKSNEVTTRLKLLTLNLTIGIKSEPRSTVMTAKYIRQILADIVCLQDVSVSVYEILSDMLVPHYHMIQTFNDLKHTHGTCILCIRDKFSILEPYYYDFKYPKYSRSHSKYVLACLVRHNVLGDIQVMTINLENGNENAHARSIQFSTVQNVISEQGNKNKILLLGNFNIHSNNEEINSKILNSGLKDAWIKLGCSGSTKFTFNTKTNVIAKKFAPYPAQERFDRILYDFKKLNVVPSEMKLIGIGKKCYSSHYGLYSALDFVKGKI